jgi:hypothetical protein
MWDTGLTLTGLWCDTRPQFQLGRSSIHAVHTTSTSTSTVSFSLSLFSSLSLSLPLFLSLVSLALSLALSHAPRIKLLSTNCVAFIRLTGAV